MGGVGGVIGGWCETGLKSGVNISRGEGRDSILESIEEMSNIVMMI